MLGDNATNHPAKVWWDGELLPAAAAFVPAASTGHLWGRGVFETILVHEGQPFALTRHLARLRAGAARLALELPDDPSLQTAIAAVLTGCPQGIHRLRLTLTGGETPGLSLTPEPGHLLIQLGTVPPIAPHARLLTVPWRRNEFSPLAGLKSTSYAENAVALAWACERGATEALFLNTAGDLCEGAVSNLFIVRDGIVLTPFPDAGCLPGITRAIVLELCAMLGRPTMERALPPSELDSADEIFLTNSLRGIVPALTVDRRTFKASGPVILELAAALADLRGRLPDP